MDSALIPQGQGPAEVEQLYSSITALTTGGGQLQMVEASDSPSPQVPEGHEEEVEAIDFDGDEVLPMAPVSH